MDIELLQERSCILKGIRTFFDHRAYLEVDTPILAPYCIPETCLEVFQTSYQAPQYSQQKVKEKPYCLLPSPELYMKQLIADHRMSIYQISKCFRNVESIGRLHSPEFTMLEYYTIDADYRDSIEITEELFTSILPSGAPAQIRPPFTRISMEEAFRRWAGFSLFEAATEGSGRFREEAFKLHLEPAPELTMADLYDLIFVHAVELSLPQDTPVVLMDYPAFVPCLAKNNPDGVTKERWELYVRGIELANCYSEETDPQVIRQYFAEEGEKKKLSAQIPHAIPEEYWKVFLPKKDGKGFPDCSGVAMGFDRLVMVCTGRQSIDSVLPFPMTI
jgi:lysyl-tRNA synthetase class 2